MLRDEICAKLAELGCILTGEFRLSSGKISPYYVDLRKIPSHPDLFDKITDEYAEIARGLGGFDRVAGIATGGLPIATLVAYKLRKPLLYVRKERKAYGTGSEVEGELKAGDVVVLIDDVATTGESIVRAAEAIREAGGIVNHAIVLIDREEGARQRLEGIGVKLLAAGTAVGVIRRLHALGIIKQEDYEAVMRYLEGRRCSGDGM